MGLKKRGLLVVVVLLSLVFAFSAAAQEGCYLYAGGDERLYCQSVPQELAAEDCDKFENCNLETHFAEGQSCSNFPECRQVVCNIDCSPKASGKCAFLGGQALTPAEEAQQCGPACCQIAARNSCTWETTLYSCTQYAESFGSDADDVSFRTDITSETACANLCGAALPPEGVPPAEGTAVISGTVTAAGQPVSRATVTLVELGRFVFTDANGMYEVTTIPAGAFTLRASSPGYTVVEQRVSVAEGAELGVDFALLPGEVFQGVTGTIYVDVNNDGLRQETEKRHGASVSINNIFQGYSQYASGRTDSAYGTFRLLVDTPDDYAFSASYEGGYAVELIPFTISETQREVNLGNVFLTKTLGICTPGQPDAQKNVASFSAAPVSGRKAVQLSWQKPCPEVVSYKITRQKAGTSEAAAKLLPSPSAAQTIFVDADEELEWDVAYTYRIWAEYSSGLPSAQPASHTIKLGNAACEGKFDETFGWTSFCRSETPEDRKNVYSCTPDNQLTSTPCAGDTFYCAPLTGREATCKDDGVCSVGTNPFGLYADRAACYGTETAFGGEAANFCTFDATDSSVDACKSCANVSSCFDYRSQDACETNSCFTTTCAWVDGAANTQLIDYSPLLGRLSLPQFVSQETGAGYCVEANYEEDTFCSLCSDVATVFENFFCTADVCSNLGRCFSNPTSSEFTTADEPLSSCSSCGEVPSQNANCYTYMTEDECTGGQGTTRMTGPQLLFSDDQCGWQRCSWVSDAEAGLHCVKDGNADEQDDCAAVSGGERSQCRTDVLPSTTTVLPGGLKVVASHSSPLTFQAQDVSGTQSVHYCLTPLSQDVCRDFTDFTSQSYPGTRATSNLSLSFVDNPLIIEQAPNGESFMLKYFSVDKYANQEEVREAFVYIDVVPPDFSINEQIAVTNGQADVTLVLEGKNEPMSCTITLRQELPLGGTSRSASLERGQSETTFTGLSGLLYEATVQCTDAAGNTAEKTKLLPIDTEEHITIQSPIGTIKTRSVRFSVTTTVSASCELYMFDVGAFTKVTDFQRDTAGMAHTTVPIDVSSRYPELYREIADYRVLCLDALTGERYEELFFFIIDTTPAEAQIILHGDGRTVRPQGDNWGAFFRDEAAVGFECRTEAEGFDCISYFYCVAPFGETCRDMPLEEYTGLHDPLRLSESSNICYYPKDAGNNQPYVVRCGDVLLDSYGLTLRNPPQHFYRGELWGVSPERNFTLQFFTRVPTQECRLDFVSGFAYDAVPRFKVLTPDPATGDYRFANFPIAAGASPYPASGGVKSLYVRCQDAVGMIGPEKKINVEYDPTAPQIIEARADPDPVVEGVTTNILVDTDDKTLCRYDDAGADTFADMKYAFSGTEQKDLREQHSDLYTITTTGLQADYVITTQCANGAEALSDPETFDFTVDYTRVGNIVRLWPTGDFLAVYNLTLEVETSKNAQCDLSLNRTTTRLQGAGGRLHTFGLGNLAEGYHQYPVRCLMADQAVENVLRFTIDRTAPRVSSIEDGNYSCGSDAVNIFVYTNEVNLSAYAYEVYERESPSNRTRLSNQTGNASRVLNGTLPATLPLEIPTASLQEGKEYKVKIAARDAAGNFGVFGESNGFAVVNRSHAACAVAGLPDVVVQLNESDCAKTTVALHCEDAVGCRSFLYGQSASVNTCQAVQPYNGQQLSFDSPGWVCYDARDTVNKNQTGSKRIAFADADGDSIRDSCDRCSETRAGKVVDGEGCATDQVTLEEAEKDADADGLPDAWENRYNKEGCLFNSTAVDSDGDGVRDNAADYDEDGFSNYDEFVRKTDPCRAEAVREDKAPGSAAEEGDIVALVFLVVGLLLIVGGTGYLVYLYIFAQKKGGAKMPLREAGPALAPTGARPAPPEWQKKLVELRRAREKRKKERERQEVFEPFKK